jgi:nicotinamide riboside kinase
MRLVIVGAQSTGKSTLAADLAERLPSSRVEPEPFRVLRKQLELISGADTMTPEQELALIEHNQRRLAAVRGQENVVYDRCALDALAHACVARDLGNHAFTNEWIKRLETETSKALAVVDVLVLVRIGSDLPLIDDGVRSTDEPYRKRVDEKITSLAREHPGFMEVKGTRQERVDALTKGLVDSGWL